MTGRTFPVPGTDHTTADEIVRELSKSNADEIAAHPVVKAHNNPTRIFDSVVLPSEHSSSVGVHIR